MQRTALLLFLLAACGADPAPADLDGLARWFWVNFDVADDEEIALAADKLYAAVDGANLDEALKVSVAHLKPGDVENVGMEGKGDLAFARGMCMVAPLKCTMEKNEELSIHLDQKGLFGGYDKYERKYTSDLDAYKRREATLTWTTDYTVSGLGSKYHAHVLGEARFVPAAERRRAVYLQRAWLTEPATFPDEDPANPDADFFKQDYQIIVVFERAPGDLLRMFALWRQMRFAGFDTEGDVIVDFTLNGLVQTNDKLEEICNQ